MSLHIVLFEPEIPQNTGNIARTCAGFNAILHLIRPYGFIFNKNSAVFKRSGVNYWDKVEVIEHDSFDDFIKTIDGGELYFITRYGKKHTGEIKFDSKKDTYIIFGKESTGISKDILKKYINQTYRIPSSSNVRSLNVSNCVAMLVYSYEEQIGFEGLEKEEPFKKDIL